MKSAADRAAGPRTARGRATLAAGEIAAGRATRRRRLLIGVGALAALAVGGLAFELLRQRAASESAVTELVSESAAAASVAEPQREVLVGLLRRIEQRADLDTDARLVRSRVRLLLTLQRPQAAWDVIASRAMAPDAGGEDLTLGARALAGAYATAGKADDALRAIALARRAHQITGDVEPLFLAWQVATRAGEHDTADAVAAELREQHGDKPQARLAQLYGAVDFAHPQPSAAAIEELAEALTASPEATLLQALLRLQSDSEGDRRRGIEDLEAVLQHVPAYRDARLLAVAAYEMQGEQAPRDAHLRWLLANAPGDPRRAQWEQRLQTPVR